MGKNSDEFLCLQSEYPKVRDAELKEGIFIGPQVRTVMKSLMNFLKNY